MQNSEHFGNAGAAAQENHDHGYPAQTDQEALSPERQKLAQRINIAAEIFAKSTEVYKTRLKRLTNDQQRLAQLGFADIEEKARVDKELAELKTSNAELTQKAAAEYTTVVRLLTAFRGSGALNIYHELSDSHRSYLKDVGLITKEGFPLNGEYTHALIKEPLKRVDRIRDEDQEVFLRGLGVALGQEMPRMYKIRQKYTVTSSYSDVPPQQNEVEITALYLYDDTEYDDFHHKDIKRSAYVTVKDGVPNLIKIDQGDLKRMEVTEVPLTTISSAETM